MSYDWVKIKAEIEKETRDVFSQDPSFNIGEALEIFRKVLEYPTHQPELKLDGLPDLLYALERILVHNEITGDNFNALALPFEAYLKKVLYLVNQPYYLANAHNITLGDKFDKNRVLIANGLIRELNLNHGNFQYWLRNMPAPRHVFDEHLWQAYNLRNNLAHFCTSYNRNQFWSGVQSYLVMYLYAAHKHRQALIAAIEPYFLSTYLQNYIADYKQWQTRFVPMASIEFEKIELWASEIPEEERQNKGQGNPDNKTKEPKQYRPQAQRRSGTIDELRHKVIEKQMVVIAEPGMGKSTSLQYIAYTDALAIEKGDTTKPYPVYIELKEFQTGDVIQDRVIRKLAIDAGVTKNLLGEGKVSLLLDGLNEVAEAHREEAIKAIQRFMADYPKVFVLITSRPNAYERYYFDNIPGRGKAPVFQLQQMELPQIEEFLQKNSGQEPAGIILKAIEANEALKNIIKTPLLLKMLIALVSQQPQAAIPPTETNIILGFISGICDWEVEQNASFNPKTFLERLTYLAHQTRMRNEANTAVAEEEILQVLQQKAPEWELKELLKKAVELRLLAHDKTENRYSFIHEVYQEALWAKQQVRFDAYPPAANTDAHYTPALQLWHKPGFKESLRLYSALLQGQQRMDFVYEIAKRNVLLAARCKTACWHPEPELRQMIIERAKLFAVFFDSVKEWCAQGFAALMVLEASGEIVEVLKTYEEEVDIEMSILKDKNFAEQIRAVGDFRAIVDLYCIVLKNTKKETAKEMLQMVYTNNVTEELVCEQQLQQIAQTFKDKKEYENLLLLDANMQTLYLCSTEEVVNIVYHELFLKKEVQSFDIRCFDVLLCIIDKYRLPEVLDLKDFNSMLSSFMEFGSPTVNLINGFSVNKRDRYPLLDLHLYSKYGLPCMLPIFVLVPFVNIGEAIDIPFEVLPKTELETFIDCTLLIGSKFRYSYGGDGFFEFGVYLAAKHNLYNKDFFEEIIKSDFLEDDNLISIIEEKYSIYIPPLTSAKPLAELKAYLNAEIPDANYQKAFEVFESNFVENDQTKLDIDENGIKETSNIQPAKVFIQKLLEILLKWRATLFFENAQSILQQIDKYNLQDIIPLNKIVDVFGKGFFTVDIFNDRVIEDKIKLHNIFSIIERIYNTTLSLEQKEKIEVSTINIGFFEIEKNRNHLLENGVLPHFENETLNLAVSNISLEIKTSTNVEFKNDKNSYIEFCKLVDLLDLKDKFNVHVLIENALKETMFTVAVWLLKKYNLSNEYKAKLTHSIISFYEKRKSKPNYKKLNPFLDFFQIQKINDKLLPYLYITEIDFSILKNLFNQALVVQQLYKEGALTKTMLEDIIDDVLSLNTTKLERERLSAFYKDKDKAKKLLSYLPELLTAFDLQSQYPLVCFIEKAIELDIIFAKQWVEELGFEKNYTPKFWIEKALNTNFSTAIQWIEDDGLQNDFPIHLLIKKALKADIHWALKQILLQGLPESIKIEYILECAIFSGELYNESIAMIVQLINQYKVKNRFLIVSFSINLIANAFSKGKAWYVTKKYNVNWGKEMPKVVLQAIKKGYANEVKAWSDEINLDSFVNTAKMVETAIETKQMEVAVYWVEKYNLYEQFPQFEPPGEAAEEDTTPPEEA